MEELSDFLLVSCYSLLVGFFGAIGCLLAIYTVGVLLGLVDEEFFIQ